MTNVNKELKELRQLLGISQDTFARVLNMKRSTYAQYENGLRKIPHKLSVIVEMMYNEKLVADIKKMKYEFFASKLLRNGDE